jgi:hypothetical protein
MKRFFFDLCGGQETKDPVGLPFETELQAFRAAVRLAVELGSARPMLQNNTSVVVSRCDADDLFCVSVRSDVPPSHEQESSETMNG